MQTDKRKEELVNAARELFETRGLTNTSIANITERVGVTRSLFYHYFSNKQDIVDAVVDNCVDEFMNIIEQHERERWGKQDTRESLREATRMVREFTVGEESFGQYVLTEENSLLRQRFAVRAAKRFADKCVQMDMNGGLLEKRYGMKYPRADMYVLCVGMMSLLFQRPDVPEEALMEMIASMMHLSI